MGTSNIIGVREQADAALTYKTFRWTALRSVSDGLATPEHVMGSFDSGDPAYYYDKGDGSDTELTQTFGPPDGYTEFVGDTSFDISDALTEFEIYTLAAGIGSARTVVASVDISSISGNLVFIFHQQGSIPMGMTYNIIAHTGDESLLGDGTHATDRSVIFLNLSDTTARITIQQSGGNLVSPSLEPGEMHMSGGIPVVTTVDASQTGYIATESWNGASWDVEADFMDAGSLNLPQEIYPSTGYAAYVICFSTQPSFFDTAGHCRRFPIITA